VTKLFRITNRLHRGGLRLYVKSVSVMEKTDAPLMTSVEDEALQLLLGEAAGYVEMIRARGHEALIEPADEPKEALVQSRPREKTAAQALNEAEATRARMHQLVAQQLKLKGVAA